MTIPSTPATLEYLRDNARSLLNEFDAADALASYYTLYHDPARTTLFMHRDSSGMVDGFLARCQTGFDLFRPLVTLRLRGGAAIPNLLVEALAPGRPYIMIVPASLVEKLTEHLSLSDISHNLILRLDPARFTPEINVLVIRSQVEGNPRAEIRHGDTVVASAGVNWRSPVFAEIYVRVQDDQQGQGLGRAALTALVSDLIKMKITPLYSVAASNEISRGLAMHVGFVDTGAREVMAQAVRTPWAAP